MPKRNPEVDAYIASAPAYAQPVLTHIRTLFHKAFPDIAEEMKWNAPHFTHQGIVAGMAAFKAHIRFGFWKGKLLAESHADFKGMKVADMSVAKIESLADLPADRELVAMIKAAVAFNIETVTNRPKSRPAKVRQPAQPKRQVKREIQLPPDLRAALGKNKAARATFAKFSYSHQREYIEWITEAKREETRTKRLAQTIEWLSEGKPRNWKYMRR